MSEIGALVAEMIELRFGLSAEQCAQFERYYELLIDWNRRINLTAITEPRQACSKHFLDSLLRLEDVSFAPGESLLDVGTGAGFPGIPLAIACPELEVTLLDSLRKRVDFLQAVLSELGLSRVQALHERAELLVARLPLLAEYCLPFLRLGGGFIACKGPNGAAELEEAAKALQILGGSAEQTFIHSLPGGESRDILLIRKTAPTPKRFPRNPGAAAKAPLV